MTNQIVDFRTKIASESSVTAADLVIAGDPRQQIANYFSDPTQQFHSGIWSSTRGKWRVRYTESELCVITAGKVLLIADDGTRNTFQQGDAFVVPAGYCGSWEVIEDCVKIYAIFESQR